MSRWFSWTRERLVDARWWIESRNPAWFELALGASTVVLMMAILSSTSASVSSGAAWLGFFFVSLLESGLFFALLRLLDPARSRRGNSVLLALALLVVGGTGVARLMLIGPLSGYVIPAAALAMTVAVILDGRSAVLSSVIISMNVGMLTGFQLRHALVALIVGVLSSLLVARAARRVALLAMSLPITFLGAFAVLAVELARGASAGEAAHECVWGAVGGFSSGLLACILIYAFERAFNLATRPRLASLSDPAHPLLKRLMHEATGTYDHSILVANLAEAAAGAIGADPLLARVGGYYHDIGKLVRPEYFSENQLGLDNPHDRLSTQLFTLAINAHVQDGRHLAMVNGLPQLVVDIIGQHHGASVVAGLHEKATALSQGMEVEDDYRYEAFKPKSKEAAIVMLADGVATAVRALELPTRLKIRDVIGKVVDSLARDGQLDESDLGYGELSKICGAFDQQLNGLIGHRIAYPERGDKPEGRGGRGHSPSGAVGRRSHPIDRSGGSQAAATSVAPPPSTWPAQTVRPATNWRSGPVLDDVQFTVYRPSIVRPEKWYSLLAFAHLAERPTDAPPNEPDPIHVVERAARVALGDRHDSYRMLRQDSSAPVPRESEITFVPVIDGVTFNPERQSFRWVESVHQEEFRMRASAELEGTTALGTLSVYLGAVILAQVPLKVPVGGGTAPQAISEQTYTVATSSPYRRVFASYSRKDAHIVGELERYAAAMGDVYLRDVTNLRAGEVWSEQIQRMVDEADVFQLFWSANSMRSPYVENEWRYALGLARPSFIRPVYWEEPLPCDENRQLPPEELRRLHFQRIVPQRATQSGDDFEGGPGGPRMSGLPPYLMSVLLLLAGAAVVAGSFLAMDVSFARLATLEPDYPGFSLSRALLMLRNALLLGIALGVTVGAVALWIRRSAWRRQGRARSARRRGRWLGPLSALVLSLGAAAPNLVPWFTVSHAPVLLENAATAFLAVWVGYGFVRLLRWIVVRFNG
jgi:putative nucleotidyltransferase with HDIG domain